MWVKVLTNVIISLITSLAQKALQIIMIRKARKKRVEETQEVAQEIENAKTQDDVRRAVDNLP